MVTGPTPTIVTVFPVTEATKGSELVKTIGLPEAPPVAVNVKGVSPYVLSTKAPKEITWSAIVISAVKPEGCAIV